MHTKYVHLSGIYLDYFSSPVFLPFNEFPPLLASPPANIVEQSSSLWGEGGRGPNNYPDGGVGGGEGGMEDSVRNDEDTESTTG